MISSCRRLLPEMMPIDIVALQDANLPKGDLVLEVCVAWLKDPAAIRSLLDNLQKKRKYTAKDLMAALHQVSWP